MTRARTLPLATKHSLLKARWADFAGWQMPLLYQSIVHEHNSVRQNVGVFDISHMGNFFVKGQKARDWLNEMLSNDINKLSDGKGQYTFLLNPQGGVIDDLIVYQLTNDYYFLVVNAPKTDEDFAWLKEHLPSEQNVGLDNQSEDFSGLAIQGRNSPQVFEALRKTFHFKNPLPEHNGISLESVHDKKIFFCRTGYTGEDGFECFCHNEIVQEIFQEVLEAGVPPCGLAARDTLRLEKCYPLNGNDLSPQHSPLEAGLGFAVSLKKNNLFIGRKVLEQQKAQGLPSILSAILMDENTPPPRAHYLIFSGNNEALGELCSAGLSPSLSRGIAMAYLPPQFAEIGTRLQIDIREQFYGASVVKKPFVS